jgi:hypothetical protein
MVKRFFLPLLLLFSMHLQAQQGPSDNKVTPPQSDPAAQDQGEDKAARLITEQLLNELDDAIAKTEAARDRVKKAEDISRRIEQRLNNKQVNDDDALTATATLRTMLRASIDQLYSDASVIHSRVENDVLPLYRATTAKMTARLERLEPTDANYAELQKLLDRAVENQSHAISGLQRLEANIGLLRQVKARLLEEQDLLELWKDVNLKGERMIEKLREFNERIEELYKLLMPSPA